MSSAIVICEGATISAEEVARVEKAMEELATDSHAAREITLTATLHIHHEFPNTLYKGKETKSVADAEEEAAAVKAGFGPYDHKAFTELPSLESNSTPAVEPKEPIAPAPKADAEEED